MKSYIVGLKGGVASFCCTSTGEVLAEVPLTPGVHHLASLVRFRASGHELRLSGGVLVSSQGNTARCKPPGQFESSANPFFRVSPAARQQRELVRMMQRTEALSRRTAKQLQALKRAKQAVPQIEAPKPDLAPGDDAALPAS